MAFIYCVFCDLVSDIHSAQLRYCHPDVRSGYRSVVSDVFEHCQYPAGGLDRNGESICNGGSEYARTRYSHTFDDGSHRLKSPVNDCQQMRQDGNKWLPVADVSYHTHNGFSAFFNDCYRQSPVKRCTLFHSELSTSHHCHCCAVTPGWFM